LRSFNSPNHGSNIQHLKHQAKTNLIKVCKVVQVRCTGPRPAYFKAKATKFGLRPWPRPRTNITEKAYRITRVPQRRIAGVTGVLMFSAIGHRSRSTDVQSLQKLMFTQRLADHALAVRPALTTAHCAPCGGRVRPTAASRTAGYMLALGAHADTFSYF